MISPRWRIRARCSGRWRRTRPCWRVLDSIGDADLAAVAAARAAARAVAWAQRAEQTGNALPACLVAGVPLLDGEGRPVLVIDDDATIVVTHSEKERTAATFTC